MYFVSTIQPHLQETTEPGYVGAWLTLESKKDVINKFYKYKKELPLCIDHCDADEPGFIVPYRERIGRILDLLIDENGDLIAKGELYGKHDKFSKITQGIQLKGEKWGVSVWLDIYDNNIKDLTHVALTLDPKLKDQNSFIHQYSTNEKTIDKVIIRHYYKESKGECYISDQYKKILSPLIKEFVDKEQLLNMSQQQVANNESSSTGNQSGTTETPLPNETESNVSTTTQSSTKPFKLPSTNWDDIFDMRKSLKEMDEYVENSKIPYQRQPRDFKSKYAEIESKIDEANIEHHNYISALEKEAGLSPHYSKTFKIVLDNNNIPIEEARPFVAYTAASSAAYKKKEDENKALFEKFKASESISKKRKEENEQLSRDLEELKRSKFIKEPTTNNYNKTSSSSFNDATSYQQAKSDEGSRYNLLSAFSGHVIKTQPIDSWLSNLIPGNGSIYEAPISYETDMQGVNQARSLAQHMSKHLSNPNLNKNYGGSFAQNHL